jgi:opacity protein-like surface antigen
MNYQNSKLRLKPNFCKVLGFALVFLFLMINRVVAGTGPYFTLTGSMDSFGDSSLNNVATPLSNVNIGAGFSDTGLGFNNSIGYKFKNSFSAELEFSYKSKDFRGTVNGDLTSKSFLLNGLYSFNIREFYTPYLGYGIGYSFHESNLFTQGDRSDMSLAYQLKMGIDIDISKKMSLLLGYRYLTTDNIKFKDYFSAEWTSHGIEAGIKLPF